jgi:hypothetical protein
MDVDGKKIAFFSVVDTNDFRRGRYCTIDADGDYLRYFLDDEVMANGRPAWRP